MALRRGRKQLRDWNEEKDKENISGEENRERESVCVCVCVEILEKWFVSKYYLQKLMNVYDRLILSIHHDIHLFYAFLFLPLFCGTYYRQTIVLPYQKQV